MLAAKNEMVDRLKSVIAESADEILSRTLSKLTDSPAPLGGGRQWRIGGEVGSLVRASSICVYS